MTEEMTIEERMKEEDQIREKIDEKGNQWWKLYLNVLMGAIKHQNRPGGDTARAL